MGAARSFPRLVPALAVALCAVLLLLFGSVALLAARSKCATMDEPLHAVGAFLHVFHRDWRINPEDPPLWNYLAMAPHDRSALRVDFDHPEWTGGLSDTGLQTRITTRTLYQTPGNDGARFIEQTRRMMILVGIALGVLIAGFSWKLGGPVAALVAVGLFSSDPNFMAHAPLVKNDVAISLLILAASVATWSVGKRLTWWNLTLLGLLGGAAAATKFSGLLVGPIVIVALLIRALLPAPWPVLRWPLRGVAAKLGAAAAVCLVCAAFGWLVIWASYGFRFEPTHVPGERLNLASQVRAAQSNAFFLEHGRFPDDPEIAEHPPSPAVRAALASERARLLPHAYAFGLLFTYQSSLVRMSYLLGEISLSGWWYYFPLAMLFKTPLATLATLLLAGAALCSARFGRAVAPSALAPDRWTIVSLLTAPVIYLLASLTTNLNLGIRHLLPLYPFIYVAIGLVAAAALSIRPRRFTIIAAVLGVGLVVETALAFPHYIPFFNAIAKPHALHLLSDSNLDWGQGLPLLAEWQRQNPDTPLYLAYFGSVDPAFYGIDYINLPPGFFLGPPFQWPDAPGVVAVSATYLQGNHMPLELRPQYAALMRQTPRKILGGSIYLYDYGPQTESEP